MLRHITQQFDPPFDQAQTEEEREMRKQQELEKRRDEERQAKHGQTTYN